MVLFTLIASAAILPASLLAHSSSEIKINNSVNNAENNISVSTSSNSNTKVLIENDRFEIEGKADSKSQNNIVVSGQSISIANINVSNISAGNQVKVTGRINNSILYAESIEKIGSSTGESKIEIKQESNKTVTNTPVSPSVSPASATDSSDAKIEVEASQSNNLIVKLLQQIIKLLENIF